MGAMLERMTWNNYDQLKSGMKVVLFLGCYLLEIMMLKINAIFRIDFMPIITLFHVSTPLSISKTASVADSNFSTSAPF